MEIRQQLSVLKEWQDELHSFMTNNATQQNTLKKWFSEIQSLDALNASLWTSVKQWTQDFINICQVNQLELVHVTERHYERTNRFLEAFRKELEFFSGQLPLELDTVLKTFQQKEVNLLHVLQTEAQVFFYFLAAKDRCSFRSVD
ncbi:hypothetical protein CHS0354_040341 [Potamilus streckersoni]|uniref:Uncharacterized protein n=1 Tax=Potamilus streckersoni TaxID=2493646 RepID=A0AAE0VMH7_9BIVA|nr:hypothetical protein CHS0354_040341 [Potamilus streckersoni]